MADRPWLAHYPAEVPARLSYPEVPLYAFLSRSASRRAAMIFFGRRTSYDQLWRQALTLAASLRRRGIRPGDRIATALPNCPQAAVAFFGILAAGAVAVPCNPLYTERELAFQLKDSGARGVIALDLLRQRIEAARGDVEWVAYASIGEALPAHLATLQRMRERPKPIPRGERFAELLNGSPEPPTPAAPDSLAVLQYTGGTTGTSKGCMLTHANLVANMVQGQAWLYRTRPGKEVILAVLPLFHVYGLSSVLNYGVASGATLVMVPRLDYAQLVSMIKRYRPSMFPGAPTIYAGLIRYLEQHPTKLPRMEAGISGSAPLAADTQSRFEHLSGINLVEGYGLSEASPVTHCNPVWGGRRAGSIGLPWPDTDARIIDPDTGAEAAMGEVGELCVRGPQVMRGYWRRPEETADVLSTDGWLRTGDLARMDDDGFFYIVGRRKDLIIASGYNIYPREVEEVLLSHPGVDDAAVVGVADPYRGETVKAFIVGKATPEELDAFCRQRLAVYKVPKQYEFRDSLPRSAVGKVLYRVLRDES
ncbi:MAG TPA: long-chain fatty acid--CoA ligase [Bacillota bacterium]|nr:long-chain fatty acid--CoA ligase [Bacillota bacterium]